jgi:hypothetical protein
MAIRSHNQSSPYKTSRYKTSVHNLDPRFDGIIRTQGHNLDWNLLRPFIIADNNKENSPKRLMVRKNRLTELPTIEWKCSKINRLEVFVECALKNWGVKFDSIDERNHIIVFEIYNFPKYCNYSTSGTHGMNINERMKERLRNLEGWFSEDLHNSQCFTKSFKVTLLQKYYETVINIYNGYLK